MQHDTSNALINGYCAHQQSTNGIKEIEKYKKPSMSLDIKLQILSTIHSSQMLEYIHAVNVHLDLSDKVRLQIQSPSSKYVTKKA